jgi:hypothetical protein
MPKPLSAPQAWRKEKLRERKADVAIMAMLAERLRGGDYIPTITKKRGLPSILFSIRRIIVLSLFSSEHRQLSGVQ